VQEKTAALAVAERERARLESEVVPALRGELAELQRMLAAAHHHKAEAAESAARANQRLRLVPFLVCFVLFLPSLIVFPRLTVLRLLFVCRFAFRSNAGGRCKELRKGDSAQRIGVSTPWLLKHLILIFGYLTLNLTVPQGKFAELQRLLAAVHDRKVRATGCAARPNQRLRSIDFFVSMSPHVEAHETVLVPSLPSSFD
jgi:hypothetical protein